MHLRLAPQLDLPGYKPNTKPHSRQVREAAKLIAEARKPVLYVGGGVIRGEATRELMDLAELTGIPVVTTLMARGAFPDSHPQNLGMPGMHGTVAAVAALQRSDLIIALVPASTTGLPASWTPSPRRPRSSTSTSTRPRSARTGTRTSRSWVTSNWRSLTSLTRCGVTTPVGRTWTTGGNTSPGSARPIR